MPFLNTHNAIPILKRPHRLTHPRALNMKIEEKEEAIKLRRAGATYGEILKQIPASKSSLSYWLRTIELTESQKHRIHGKDLCARRKFVDFNATRHKKTLAEKENIFKESSKEISGITPRELLLIGIALYWAEGYKTDRARGVEFANSDPAMIQLMMKWFRDICGVQENKIRIRIQIHDSRNIRKSMEFWSIKTGVSLAQFTKPYIKTSPTSQRKAGNLLEHGVCHIRISDSRLLTKVRGWINGLGGPIV